MYKNLALIQARMGSKRYPGKILKKISKNTLIEWVIKRVKKSKKINKIILATTTNKKDDILEQITKKNKISIYRGKNNDVLDRFYNAAKKYKAQNIIRICADNPFIDPKQIDLLVGHFNSKKYDYACNHQNKLNSRYADGFGAEIFTFFILKKLQKEVKKKKHREHMTTYIWDNLDKFKVLSIKAPNQLAYPSLKFDINTRKDFQNINNLVLKNNLNLNSSSKQIVKVKIN